MWNCYHTHLNTHGAVSSNDMTAHMTKMADMKIRSELNEWKSKRRKMGYSSDSDLDF